MTTPHSQVSIDLAESLRLILRNAVSALGGYAGVAAAWNEAERHFETAAAYGLDERELARLRPWLNEAIPDLANSRRSFNWLSEIIPESQSSFPAKGEWQNPIVALPLRVGSATLGLIFVLRPAASPAFTDPDLPALAAFAEQAAIAMQNARLAHLLEQERQRLEAMLEGSAQGIFSVNGQRRIVGLNRAMEQLLGRPREQIMGQWCGRALNLRDFDGAPICPQRCPLLQDPDAFVTPLELQGRLQTADGRDVDVALVYSVVRGPDGQPLNAVVNVRDITRQREMEDLRSTFLALLGHELQTPLAIIKGYARTLARRDGQWDEATWREGAAVIEEESDRLSRLMNRLLLASRLERGALAPQMEPTHLGDLATRLARRLEPSALRHVFQVDTPLDLPPVSADPQLLEEALLNLLDNAVKYSPEGGEIVINARASGDGVSVSVQDSGVGIPSWELPLLFQRFRRGRHPITQQTRGLGLGLYLCHAIIAAHGGRIWAESETGQGARFTFELPLS